MHVAVLCSHGHAGHQQLSAGLPHCLLRAQQQLQTMPPDRPAHVQSQRCYNQHHGTTAAAAAVGCCCWAACLVQLQASQQLMAVLLLLVVVSLLLLVLLLLLLLLAAQHGLPGQTR